MSFRVGPQPDFRPTIGTDRNVAIDVVGQLLDAMEKVMLGRADEMSDTAKAMLAERAEAELSAVDQLAAIVENHQKERDS
jgi:hypothetical protein